MCCWRYDRTLAICYVQFQMSFTSQFFFRAYIDNEVRQDQESWERYSSKKVSQGNRPWAGLVRVEAWRSLRHRSPGCWRCWSLPKTRVQHKPSEKIHHHHDEHCMRLWYEKLPLYIELLFVWKASSLYNPRNLGFNVRLVLTRIQLFTSRGVMIWNSPMFSLSCHMPVCDSMQAQRREGLKTYRHQDSKILLETFCKWQAAKKPKRDDDPLHYDHAFLFIGYLEIM